MLGATRHLARVETKIVFKAPVRTHSITFRKSLIEVRRTSERFSFQAEAVYPMGMLAYQQSLGQALFETHTTSHTNVLPRTHSLIRQSVVLFSLTTRYLS
jgi:hypothetical protein